jgi:F-box protein 11
MSLDPAGFMSYVRLDDQHEDGRLTEFCKRLGGEVRMQTGDEFHIFQDRNDIAWGQQWSQRINDSLDAVTFLIPIITPGFFKSQGCRDEIERFLERERQLGRNDLILPVYYVNCPVVRIEAGLEADPLGKIIASRQYADWRDLRFEPFTSPQVGKMLARLATQIVEALDRRKADPETSVPPPSARVDLQNPSPIAVPEAPTVESAAEEGLTDGLHHGNKNESPTRVVDALHRGDHSTLMDALASAEPGDRILVRPGLYKEGVIIEKPVEIIGDGELGDIVIEATGKHTIQFNAAMGRITNLTIRQAGGERWCGLYISQGRLDVEGCDIMSQSHVCVAIHGGADPRLRHNRIHDGKRAGIMIYENGQGTLEDNEIFNNTLSGVMIRTGGNPTLRHNRIYDGKQGGVMIYESGQGTLEDNEIFNNTLSGVEIKGGSNPTLRRNRIHDGKQSGVYIHHNGRGLLEDNEIFGNAYSGVHVISGGNPILRRNQITNNARHAIHVFEGGQGVFEANDLRGNARAAWNDAPEWLQKVTRTGNQE